MKLALWTMAGICLALWSGLAWSLWALLTVDPAWVDSLYSRLDSTTLGAWLNAHIPGWERILSELLDGLQLALRGLSALLAWVIGIAWAVGAAVGLLVTGLLHVALSASSPSIGIEPKTSPP
jgi:hypothetical protein